MSNLSVNGRGKQTHKTWTINAGDNRRYWGGGRQINEKRTERRQEEEREMHARAIYLETRSSGGGILGGGEREGEQIHTGNIAH